MISTWMIGSSRDWWNPIPFSQLLWKTQGGIGRWTDISRAWIRPIFDWMIFSRSNKGTVTFWTFKNTGFRRNISILAKKALAAFLTILYFPVNSAIVVAA